MSGYLPYAGKHSVQEAVVAVHFRSAFDTRAAERVPEKVKPDLTKELPHTSLIHKLPTVNIQENGSGVILHRVENETRLAGFEFAKIQANGRPARVVRFLDNALTVNFLDYEGWLITRKASLYYMKLIVSAVVLEENPVVGFNLRYIDRYTFDGPPKSPHADLLVKRNSDYLSARCFGVGPYWHCNTGWFEPLGEEDRILNQLEIGSGEVDQAPTVTIDHNAICQLKTARQSIESIFGAPADAGAGIGFALDYMHGKNKEVLKNMLLEDVAQRIGL